MALVGLDLGTGSLKALLLAEDGATLAVTSSAYPVASPRPGWAQTDPAQWMEAAAAAVAELRAARPGEPVTAVGVDGQMHGVVVTGADHKPVMPALLWADTRATSLLCSYERLPAARRHALGNPLAPGMAGPLLAWCVREAPAALRQARWALQPKDWLRAQLTSTAHTDPSDASATLLWDIPADTWARDVATELGIPLELLPAVHPSATPAGELTSAVARRLGLPAGIPVATGCGDTAATLLGAGISQPEQTQLSIGSGAQLVRVLSRPRIEDPPRVNTFRTAGDGWYAMAAVHNAGLALDWLRRLLAADWAELYATLDDRPTADQAEHPLVFIPFLTGERAGINRPDASGVLAGLRLFHDRRHIMRAALEGVAFTVRVALDALPGPRPSQVTLVGGGSLDYRFQRLLADVLDVELLTVDAEAASARGAALLAGLATGVWRVTELDHLAPLRRATLSPEPDAARRYAEPLARFRRALSS